MDMMNDIREAKELLGENLHELIEHVKTHCDGDLLDHEGELCTMKMILSCMDKACNIMEKEEQGGESMGAQRGRMTGYAYGGMRAGGTGGSQAQRRNMRTGRYMDGGNMRQEFQEKINNIPDMQTRMDMQRMLDAMGNM
jgi:hypothetical protein